VAGAWGLKRKEKATMIENIVERRIMWGDLDALGIVFYPRYYEWFDGCAHQFFEAIGIPHDRLWKEHGIVFGLAETQCRYLSAGRYHEHIKILTGLQNLNKRGLTLQHVITHGETGKTVVIGTEKRISMDASNPMDLKVTTIPEMVYQALEQALAEPKT
jgi:4-hydroxybenzoyl-CoA thioesterase